MREGKCWTSQICVAQWRDGLCVSLECEGLGLLWGKDLTVNGANPRNGHIDCSYMLWAWTLYWKDRFELPPFSPVVCQPQEGYQTRRPCSQFLQGWAQPALPGAGNSASPAKPGLKAETQSLCINTMLLLKATALLRLLVQLAPHTHSTNPPGSKWITHFNLTLCLNPKSLQPLSFSKSGSLPEPF